MFTGPIAGGVYDPRYLANNPRGRLGSRLGFLDIGPVSGAFGPRPFSILGPAPAVLLIEHVLQCDVLVLPIRRRDIEAATGGQVAARGNHVDVDAASRIAVLHGCPGVAVRRHPRPSELFKLVNRSLDLLVGGLVLRSPGNHPRRVLVLEIKGVGNIGDLLGIAPQHLNVLPLLPLPVHRLGEVVGRGRGRPAAMIHKSNQHPRP